MKIRIILITLISIWFIMPVFAQNIDLNKQVKTEYGVGRVIKVISEVKNDELQESLGGDQTLQLLQVKILSGENNGKIIEVENQLTSNPAYDISVKPNSRVVLDIEKIGNITNYYVADIERMPALMIVTGIFFLLLLSIGGMKGLKSLVSLGVTALLVFFVLIPAVLNNYPVIPVTIFVAFMATIATMFIVGGINLKSISASIGTLGGVTIAGLISTVVIKIAPLTGFTTQESIILWNSRPELDFTGLLTSAMIIAALGAAMDVGISIASSIAEFKSIDSSLTPAQLTKSGLNVGRDIMGTMSNTLILAYIGSAFPLILLASNAPIVKLINLNSIATEITAAIVGSIGIVLCVPITAIVSGYLMGNKEKVVNPETDLETINN